MNRSIAALLWIASASGLGACASQSSSPTQSNSALTGQLDRVSFGAGTLLLVAVDRRGVEHVATVATNGSFRLELPATATYRLSVRNVDAGKTIAVVFPRVASMQRDLLVRTAGVAAGLGIVRLRNATTPVAPVTDTESQDCNDGVDASGSACVDDKAENDYQTCAAESAGSAEIDHVDQTDSDAETNDGVDNVSTESADVVAVPSVNPPAQLGACGSAEGEAHDDSAGPDRANESPDK